MQTRTVNEIVFLDFFSGRGEVIAAFSTRAGGRSEGRFQSLNMGLNEEINTEAVISNRKSFAEATGIKGPIAFGRQTHGNRIRKVTIAERGRGFLSREDAFPGTDGLWTNERNVPIGVMLADCAGIVLFDPETPSVAVVHAGWRGLAKGIPELAVRSLCAENGVDPGRIMAGISPAIGACCYEVGSDMEQEMISSSPESAKFFNHEQGVCRFDLSGAVLDNLMKAGIVAGNIESAGMCVSCRADLFYSYRRDKGVTGRHALVAMLR